MKKTFVYIMAAVAAIAAVSCSKIENEQVEKGLTFTASFDPEVRTTIGTGNAVSWVDGDVITIVDESNVKVSHTISEAAGDKISGNSVTFTVTSTDLDGKTLSGQLYAIHGGANPSFSDGAFHFDIPTAQDGSFNQANICVAKADGANLAFHNATAIVHLTGYTSTAAVNFKMEAKGGEVAMFGSCTATFGEKFSVSCSLPSGLKDKKAQEPYQKFNITLTSLSGTDYYFAVAPGVTYKLSCDNGLERGEKIEKKIENASAVMNEIYSVNFAEIMPKK